MNPGEPGNNSVTTLDQDLTHLLFRQLLALFKPFAMGTSGFMEPAGCIFNIHMTALAEVKRNGSLHRYIQAAPAIT